MFDAVFTLKTFTQLIWTKSQVVLGALEGFNNIVKFKKTYGYRNYGLVKITLFKAIWDLPKPKGTLISSIEPFKIPAVVL